MKIYYLIRSISVDAENFLQMKDVISFKNVFLAPIDVEIPELAKLFFTWDIASFLAMTVVLRGIEVNSGTSFKK